jgi:hypothetical protein
MSNKSHAESEARVTQPRPTIGRIVIFTLDAQSASDVPSGGYAAKDEAPAIVTRARVDSPTVNLKVFLDGPIDLSVLDVRQGAKGEPRTWRWPERG